MCTTCIVHFQMLLWNLRNENHLEKSKITLFQNSTQPEAPYLDRVQCLIVFVSTLVSFFSLESLPHQPFHSQCWWTSIHQPLCERGLKFNKTQCCHEGDQSVTMVGMQKNTTNRFYSIHYSYRDICKGLRSTNGNDDIFLMIQESAKLSTGGKIVSAGLKLSPRVLC